jgi:hypothetical protein
VFPRGARLLGLGLLLAGLVALLYAPDALSLGGGLRGIAFLLVASALLLFLPGIWLFWESTKQAEAARRGPVGYRFGLGTALLILGNLLVSTDAPLLAPPMSLAAYLLTGAVLGFLGLLFSVPGFFLVWGATPPTPGPGVQVLGAVGLPQGGNLPVVVPLAVPPESLAGMKPVPIGRCPECQRPIPVALTEGAEVRCAACGGRIGLNQGAIWSVPS